MAKTIGDGADSTNCVTYMTDCVTTTANWIEVYCAVNFINSCLNVHYSAYYIILFMRLICCLLLVVVCSELFIDALYI